MANNAEHSQKRFRTLNLLEIKQEIIALNTMDANKRAHIQSFDNSYGDMIARISILEENTNEQYTAHNPRSFLSLEVRQSGQPQYPKNVGAPGRAGDRGQNNTYTRRRTSW